MRRLLATVAFASVAACGGLSTDIENSTVSGTWTGSTSGQTLTMSLQQAGQTVAGTGTLAGSGSTQSVSISGSYLKPTLALTLIPSTAGAAPIALNATVEGSSLVGTLTGTGLAGASIAMLRK